MDSGGRPGGSGRNAARPPRPSPRDVHPALLALGSVELGTRYDRLGRSSGEIAHELGISAEDVLLALRAFRIPMRSGVADTVSPAYLRRRYVLAGEGVRPIAKAAGCKPTDILRLLDQYGIPRRPAGGPTDPALPVLAADLATPRTALEPSPSELPVASVPIPGSLTGSSIAPVSLPVSPPVVVPPPSRRHPSITPAYLLREYVRKGRSASSIAREWGLESPEVMRMVREDGLPLHTVAPSTTPPPAARDTVHVSRELLEDRYLKQGLSARQIGQEVGISERSVLLRLHRYDIPMRPAGGGRSVQDRLTKDVLEDLHLVRGKTIAQIANELEVSAESVRRALHQHGLISSQTNRATAVAERLTKEALVEAYVTDGLKLSEIADRFDVSAETVRRYAGIHGITLDRGRYGRRAGPLAELLTEEVLRREHHENNKSLAEIAQEYGFSTEGVRRHLHKLGVPLRTARQTTPTTSTPASASGRRTTLTAPVLQSRYIDRGESIAEIATALQVTQEGVRQALKRNGIPLRVVSRPRALLDPEDLRRRYIDEHQSLADIGTALDVSSETIRRELHRLAIETRTIATVARPSEDALRTMYEVEGLSAGAIAEKIGVSEQSIRRWLRAADIEVRSPGGSRQRSVADLLTPEVYQREHILGGRSFADIARQYEVSTETVRRYAHKHGVMADHRDDPTVADILPEAWLREHYENRGWTLVQIAENRGVSAETIRRYLRRYDIDVRPAGKRSPADRRT